MRKNEGTKRKQKAVLGVLVCGMAVFMTACGKGTTKTDSKAEESRTILVLAAFGENQDLKEQVALYNQTHEDCQIQIEQYQRSNQAAEDGIARLQREIMSGKGPDIIDFGRAYSNSDIVGAYTENLIPYLKRDGYYNQEYYFTNIMEAFSYNDGLYALPVSFTLETFAGSRKDLGGRDYWNIQEMIACYEEQVADKILYPGQTKKDVFGTILTGTMEYYIDWEQGKCSFDGEEFKEVMSFANTFPDTLVFTEEDSVKQLFYQEV